MTATRTAPNAASVLDRILESGVIAVVRLPHAAPMIPVAAAIADAGIAAFEITMTTPGALEAVRDLAASDTSCVIGAGTILDARGAAEVIEAGAQFVVSPTLDEGMIRYCLDRGVMCIPGAFSPTEILRAWNLGARLIKVFPSSSVRPEFMKNVLAPLPFLKMSPSGGTSVENAADWIRAGAVAISASTNLITPARVKPEGLAELTADAKRWVAAVADGRAGKA